MKQFGKNVLLVAAIAFVLSIPFNLMEGMYLRGPLEGTPVVDSDFVSGKGFFALVWILDNPRTDRFVGWGRQGRFFPEGIALHFLCVFIPLLIFLVVITGLVKLTTRFQV
jgi:hypothetical protein